MTTRRVHAMKYELRFIERSGASCWPCDTLKEARRLAEKYLDGREWEVRLHGQFGNGEIVLGNTEAAKRAIEAKKREAHLKRNCPWQ